MAQSMRIDSLVTSKDLSEKLHKANPQLQTYFVWFKQDDGQYELRKREDCAGVLRYTLPAALSDELLAVLNEELSEYWLGDDWDLVLADGYYRLLGHDELPSFDGDTLAELFAHLWLWGHKQPLEEIRAIIEKKRGEL